MSSATSLFFPSVWKRICDIVGDQHVLLSTEIMFAMSCVVFVSLRALQSLDKTSLTTYKVSNPLPSRENQIKFLTMNHGSSNSEYTIP